MLQIFLHGPFSSGWLDVAPETSLSMEGLTELFDEDLSVGEFSLPVEIPWTPRNRKLFNFAERLENFGNAKKFFTCDVYDRGFPELISAKLTILERTGTFAFTKGSFSASIAATRGLYGSLIKGKSLKDLQLGGTINWSTEDSRHFAYNVMTGVYPQYNYIAFAPVAIEDYIDAKRPDYNGEFLRRDCVNNVIVQGSTWTFGSPNLTTGAPVLSGDGYIYFRTIPFFKLKYVLKKCFEEFGFTVSGDFMSSTDFDDVVIFNNWSIDNMATSNQVDYNRSITPANHMPDMPIAEFLKAWLGYLNLYPVFTGATDVQLRSRSLLLKNKVVYGITNICTTNFTSTYQNTDNTTGYKLAFAPGGSDSFFSDRVKDIKDKILAASVARRSDLDALNVGYQLTTNHIAYVQADNLYYQVADGTSTPLKWDVYAEALNDYVKGDGARSIEVKLAPLCTYAEKNTATALFEKRDYVGCKMPGSYINNLGTRVKNPFDLLVFYIQMRNINGVTKPVSFNGCRDVANNKILPYSLAWSGDDGIAGLHDGWQSVQDSGEIVKTTILYDQRIRSEIEKSNTLEINGVQFLLNKQERNIPAKGTAVIYLMPL